MKRSRISENGKKEVENRSAPWEWRLPICTNYLDPLQIPIPPFPPPILIFNLSPVQLLRILIQYRPTVKLGKSYPIFVVKGRWYMRAIDDGWWIFFLFKGLIIYTRQEMSEKPIKHENLYLNIIERVLVEEQIIKWYKFQKGRRSATRGWWRFAQTDLVV